MKKIFKFFMVVYMAIMCLSFIGCEDSNVVVVKFSGWGDPSEIEVFNGLVKQFNKAHEGEIRVDYTQIPSADYSTTVFSQLQGNRTPDVVYVGDGDVKKWVSATGEGLLAPLDDYVKDSEVIDFSDMWESSISRYRYDKVTKQSLSTAPLYGLPKDIGPTVIYYNADALKSVGVTIVSKYINDPTITNDEKFGYNINKKIFNNKIAMTWEECDALATLLTKSHNTSSPTTYGYYTNWWFSYGWSIGGDVIKFDETAGKYKFTLGDPTVLPAGISMFDAFKYFVDLSITKEISPLTSSVGSQGSSHKMNFFTSKQVAMYVDLRAVVPELRKKANFDWDVAPLPKHANGIEAGHSGSMALGISQRSRKKDSAYKFVEFIAGVEGQTAQALTGFNIPNQKSIAHTEVFLQSDKKPKNSIIFCDAAEYQRPGDWNYLPDRAWIDIWAEDLNGKVLDKQMSLTAFFNTFTSEVNEVLAGYTD